jgi:transketolase
MMNKELRKKIIQIVDRSKEGHIPSSFSIVDIVDVLYSQIISFNVNNPKWEERDYFILSKGHGAAALYVVLHKHKIISDKDLELYCQQGGILGGHPDSTCVPGVEASTGSLGHGLPIAAGIALGLRIQNKTNRIFALIGDGECNEGTIWETALVAAKHQLGNLTLIVDLNGSIAPVLPIDPLAEKWLAFGWKPIVIDGHDPKEIQKAFADTHCPSSGPPKIVIAKTVKGKGVSFMENKSDWHHRIPSASELQQINSELE